MRLEPNRLLDLGLFNTEVARQHCGGVAREEAVRDDRRLQVGGLEDRAPEAPRGSITTERAFEPSSRVMGKRRLARPLVTLDAFEVALYQRTQRRLRAGDVDQPAEILDVDVDAVRVHVDIRQRMPGPDFLVDELRSASDPVDANLLPAERAQDMDLDQIDERQ